MKKIIYRARGKKEKDSLLMCERCGRLHYVKPGEYTGHPCRGCGALTVHLNVPEIFRDRSRRWYVGPRRVPSEYLP